ncbi:hypothetical protein, partial [Thermococcus sp. GR4]|uniref:hypothetical protein n=1 Tax=Thermococcus sp. GR4 TaxID=1638254 RepID=UPI00197E1086
RGAQERGIPLPEQEKVEFEGLRRKLSFIEQLFNLFQYSFQLQILLSIQGSKYQLQYERVPSRGFGLLHSAPPL